MTKQLWRTITTNVFWKGLQLGSTFLLNIAIARAFKAGGSGDFLFQIANLQLAVAVASLSIESGLQYYGAADTGLLGRFSSFTFRYAGAAFGALLGILAALVYVHLVKPDLDPLLFILYSAGFIAGTLLFRFFSVLGYGVRIFVAPAAAEAGGNVLLLGLLALQPSWGHPVFFLFYFAMPLCCGLFLYGVLRRRRASLFASVAGKKIHFPSLLRYSGLSFLSNLVFFGVYRMDYWWVAAYCLPGELGNYIQASKLAQLFIYLPQLISLIIFPDVVQGMANRDTIRKIMGYTVLIYTGGIALLLAFGSRGLVWLLGPTFGQVYPAFLRLIPGVYALGLVALLAAYFAARNRVKVNLYGGLASLVVMFLGDMIFIPRYHIMAAAVVSSVSYGTYFVFEWFVFTFRDKASDAAPFNAAASGSTPSAAA
jgi:O-antigen/teichoic acid export membrane protein